MAARPAYDDASSRACPATAALMAAQTDTMRYFPTIAGRPDQLSPGGGTIDLGHFPPGRSIESSKERAG
ncbi:hypothetical protein ACU4GD_40945, partial [Cupriavidus basilensis]